MLEHRLLAIVQKETSRASLLYTAARMGQTQNTAFPFIYKLTYLHVILFPSLVTENQAILN